MYREMITSLQVHHCISELIMYYVPILIESFPYGFYVPTFNHFINPSSPLRPSTGSNNTCAVLCLEYTRLHAEIFPLILL